MNFLRLVLLIFALLLAFSETEAAKKKGNKTKKAKRKLGRGGGFLGGFDQFSDAAKGIGGGGGDIFGGQNVTTTETTVGNNGTAAPGAPDASSGATTEASNNPLGSFGSLF